MPNMFRSATFRLTIWYLALAMTISIIFSIAVYNLATNEIAWGLHHETQRIYNAFPVFNNSPLLRPGEDLDSTAHRILLKLIAVNVFVFVGAGLASYALAKRTLQPIEEAHMQQKRFTSDVSHELRTPLTALKMESEVALMNPSSTKQELEATLRSNLEEVSKLEALINTLLRLSRLEADELQQNFAPVHISSVMQEAIAQMTTVAERRNVSLEQQGGDKLLINGDQAGVTQLLVILLDNAIKYSPKDSVVKLSAKQVGTDVVLAAQDKGVGIEKAALEHVFDRFYRADSSRTKDSSEGFGLGLSIAKMIADMHAGTITLTSRVGQGTTATVSLPALTPEKD